MDKSKHAVHQAISTLLITAFVIPPILFVLPAQAARPTQSDEETMYAPFVSAGISSEITINSPKANSLVAGSFVFSAQPLNSGGVGSVDFFAGNTLLGTDSSPENGFSIELDSSEIADGQVTLRAVAHGTRDATAQISVTNVPNPAQQTSANQDGAAVAASEIGSAIMVPPGGLPVGATMTVTERSEQEISSEFGIQWDDLGVTFLGAQVVETSAEMEKPPAVSSAGFAPRVQAGQAVVNYNLAPDADGDGVAEIVVVNTARVANGNIVSDPLPELSIGDITVNNVPQGYAYAAQADLHGAPGTIIKVDVTGFNLYSPFGNLARFKSAMDGKEYEMLGFITRAADDPIRQIFSTLIPLMPAGAATMTLVNLSTMDTSIPIAINVEASSTLDRPAIEIIDELLSASIDEVTALAEEFPNSAPQFNQLAAIYTEARDDLAVLDDDPEPTVQQALQTMATLIQGSGILEPLADVSKTETQRGPWSIHPAVAEPAFVPPCFGPGQRSDFRSKLDMTEKIFTTGCTAIATSAGNTMCSALSKIFKAIDQFEADNTPNCTPPPCPPSGGGSGTTGMGSAPPPGGNLCGGGGGGGGNNPLASTASATSSFTQELGRIKVVVISNGERTPFTGSTDRGGYFFLPLVPEDKPFIAYAIDTTTGQVRSRSGIGPKTGESEWVWFDFANGPNEAIENRWTGDGDGVNWEDTQNWSLGRVPGPIDKVIIDVPTNPTIIFNSSALINSLESAEALTLAGGFLRISSPSSISGTFTVQAGEHTIDSSLTLDGLLEWSGGTLGGVGLLTLNGGALLSGTPNKRLNGLTVENNANFVFGGTGAIVGGRGVIFNNRSGATFDLASDALYDGFNLGGAGTIFNNYGTLRKSGGAEKSSMDFIFNNHNALVEVQAGTLELRHGGRLNDGTYTVANGAFFDLASTPFYTMTGILDGSGAGQMRGVGATLTTSGTATLNFPNGGFGLTAGGFGGSGEFTLQGKFLLSGTAHKIISEVTLNNEAFFQLTGTGDIVGGGAAIFNNMSGATFEIASDASYLGIDQGGIDTTFNNFGTLRKSGAGESVVDLTFNNQGALVEVQAGTLELLRGGSLVGGAYTVANGAFLDFTGNNVYSMTGTLTGSGAGEVRLAGATFKPDSSATINITGGGFAMTSGILEGPGTLTFQGIVTLSGSAAKTISGITVNNEALWTWIGPGSILGGAAAIFNNQVGATFDARTNGANITYIGNQVGGGDTTFTNNGAVIKSGDTFSATLDLCYNGISPVGVNVIDSCP